MGSGVLKEGGEESGLREAGREMQFSSSSSLFTPNSPETPFTLHFTDHTASSHCHLCAIIEEETFLRRQDGAKRMQDRRPL